MEPTETKRHFSSVIKRVRLYPRKHILAASCLTVGLTLTLSLIPSKEASATRQQQNIDLKLNSDGPRYIEAKSLPTAEAKVETPSDLVTTDTVTIDIEDTESVQPELEPSWQDYKIKSGDSLALVFKRAGLPSKAMYELINKEPKAKELTKIFPGRTLSFAIDENNQLQALRYRESKLKSATYTRTATGFKFEAENRKPEAYLAYRSATINSSLFDAGTSAGMSANLIMELANIFGWDIDFALDIRKGDSFNLLFEEKFLDGEKIGNGRILAAEFINQGDNFKAVLYTDTNGDSHYYTPDGKSMRKAFLRAPLDFNRISSNFNPRRLHPIHKTVRPHRGTDYAASRGTPVYASGKGRVITSAYNRASGNYVVIQHSNNITTKYLHLNKRKVKKGQRVNQKQLIGTVGSTGYSTAPHLHYEFLLNGVHRNPRTILQKLPKAKSIPKSEVARFQLQTQPHFAQLKTFQQGSALALADSLIKPI